MNNLVLNGSFLLLVFLVITFGVLLMTGKVTLNFKKKTGRREYGPILWPCPNCHEKVHKNMVLDHYCTL